MLFFKGLRLILYFNTRKTKTFPLEDSEMGLLYRWLEDPGLGPPEHPSLNVAIHGWILK